MLPVIDDDLVFKLPGGGYLILPVKLLETLHKYKQLNKSDTEAAGVLIGLWRQSQDNGRPTGPLNAELIDCSEPQPDDKRTRTGVIRQAIHHIMKPLLAWKNTKGIQTYMGEWHTHPETIPRPSSEDFRQWSKNLRNRQCILIIIGQEEDWVAWWDGKSAKHLTDFEICS